VGKYANQVATSKIVVKSNTNNSVLLITMTMTNTIQIKK